MNNVKIYIFNSNELRDNEEHFYDLIDDERVKKASRFLNYEAKLNSVGGALLLSAFIGKGNVDYSKEKLKSKTGIKFNISHSENICILGLSYENDLGIDIQKKIKLEQRLVDYVVPESSRNKIKSDKDFTIEWCLREAISKCTGNGLNSLIRKEIKEFNDHFEVEGCSFWTQIKRIEDYCIVCASTKKIDNIEYHFVNVKELENIIKNK